MSYSAPKAVDFVVLFGDTPCKPLEHLNPRWYAARVAESWGVKCTLRPTPEQRNILRNAALLASQQYGVRVVWAEDVTKAEQLQAKAE